MDIHENDLHFPVGVRGNTDAAKLGVSIRTDGALAIDENESYTAIGLSTDKQATATVAETIVIKSSTDHEYYTGSYEAIPRITSQTFPTEEKIMAHDFFVHTIPTTETLNAAGGYTFQIG